MPQASVLGYNEIVQGVEVESLGLVSLPEEEPGAAGVGGSATAAAGFERDVWAVGGCERVAPRVRRSPVVRCAGGALIGEMAMSTPRVLRSAG